MVKNAAIALLFLAVVSLGLEDYYLHQSMKHVARGYSEYFAMKFQGKPLSEIIRPGTLGVFISKDKGVICGLVDGTVVR